jgi:hypothetical protein
MADTGFPQEQEPGALIATSDIVNPFGSNSTIDLTRLISAAQATTLAINNLNSSLAVTGTILGAIKDAVVAGGGGSSATVSWATPPFSSSSAGTVGQISSDGSFFYVCVGTNFWCRVAVSTPF